MAVTIMPKLLLLTSQQAIYKIFFHVNFKMLGKLRRRGREVNKLELPLTTRYFYFPNYKINLNTSSLYLLWRICWS